MSKLRIKPLALTSKRRKHAGQLYAYTTQHKDLAAAGLQLLLLVVTVAATVDSHGLHSVEEAVAL